MEKHCVSLELAKQLKEAGFKKDTEFWWVEHKEITKPEFKDCIILTNKHTQLYPASSWNCIDAPLAIELLTDRRIKVNLFESLQLTKLMSPEDKIKYSDAMFVYLNYDRWYGKQILQHMPLEVARKRLTELENKYKGTEMVEEMR